MPDNPFLLPPEDDVPAEETQLVVGSTPTITSPRWSLTLPDGVRMQVNRPILLGRDPAPIPDRPGARLISVCDPDKTVSKTHALIEPTPDQDGVRVRDLNSTNGVTIVTDSIRFPVPEAGEGVARSGSLIHLGSFVIVVDSIL
jgi:hypothetical protein